MTRWQMSWLWTALLGVGLCAAGPPAAAPQGADPDRAAEGRLLSGTRQLTFEGRRAGEGYFGRDGTQMIFQSERQEDNPFFQIYLLDLATGDTRRLSPGMGKTTCAWIHPDGSRALFASTHQDPDALQKQGEELEARARGVQRRYSWDYDEFYDIYEVDLSGGSPRNLTRIRGYDAEGSWSPDGSLIAFASNRHAYSDDLSPETRQAFERDPAVMMELYIMNADGSQVRRLTDVPGYDGGPFFSPDGRRLCWRRFAEHGATAEVFTMNIDGSDVRRITAMGAMSWAPFYHPSGEYLIYTTNHHGFDNFELYLVDVTGAGAPVRVTHTPGFDGLPAFAPDGTRLAWTSNRTAGRQSQIFVADWNHAAARQMLPATVAATTQPAHATATTQPEIRAADARQYVETLASDFMDGRLTGTEGERRATAYVAEQFKRLGLQPAGEAQSYFQRFEFTAGSALGSNNELVLEGAMTSPPEVDRDWRPLAVSRTGEFAAAGVAFAGYGIIAPKSESFESYDSYVHLEVKDQWVLMFDGLPEQISPELRQHLHLGGTVLQKVRFARDQGAGGVLLVRGPNSKYDHELMRMGAESSSSGSSIPVISISRRVGAALLKKAHKDPQQLQTEWDGGQPQLGFAIPGVTVAAKVDIVRVKRYGRNVLARLPVAQPGDAAALVIGAHVDHLGRGTASNSLARDEERDQIHYGADDNASGVAGLLEIAEFLADQQSRRGSFSRDIIFAAWSGEELGTLGSQHFVKTLGQGLGTPDRIQGAVSAYLNMDMIGRLDGKLIVQGVGSSAIWRGEIERRNVPVGLPISTQDDAYLPTDATPFYIAGVPVLSVFTGSHADYHSPRDTADKVNYDGLEQVARFVAAVAQGLATRTDDPPYVAMKQERPAARGAMRAYLGTIPDYSESDVLGVKLSAVSGGAPAEHGGLRGGDIVVELAGRKIDNIYDYTDAIGALKVGEPVTVVVLRAGERHRLTVIPGSRE